MVWWESGRPHLGADGDLWQAWGPRPPGWRYGFLPGRSRALAFRRLAASFFCPAIWVLGLRVLFTWLGCHVRYSLLPPRSGCHFNSNTYRNWCERGSHTSSWDTFTKEPVLVKLIIIFMPTAFTSAFREWPSKPIPPCREMHGAVQTTLWSVCNHVGKICWWKQMAGYICVRGECVQ